MDNPYQPPEAPLNDREPGPSVASNESRPTVVTVFGILNIIFGSLQLLCMPLSILGLLIDVPGLEKNPAFAILKDPSYRVFMVVMTSLGLIAAGFLVASGIGLLQLRPWGRGLAMGYAGYAIVATVIETAVSVFYIIPLVTEAAGKAGNGDAAGVALGSALGGGVGALVRLVFPVLLLVFLNQPRVVQALHGRQKREDLPFLEPL